MPAPVRVEAFEERRLLSAALDTTFNGTGYNVLVDGFYDTVNAVRALADGRTLVAGRGRGAGFGVTRYTSDGVIDSTFGNNGQGAVSGYSRVEELLIRPDGRIVVVGVASTGGDLLIMQLTANGQVDTTFGPGGARSISLAPDGNEYVSGATLDSAGRIVVVGNVRQGTVIDGTWGGYVARITSAGAVDTTFNRNGTRRFEYGTSGDYGYIETLADIIVVNGRIIVSGDVVPPSGSPYQAVLVGYTDAGALDTGFGVGGINVIPGRSGVAALEPRGDAGGFLAASSPLVYAFNADGTTDTSFGGGTGQVVCASSVADLAVRAGDGSIFVAGSSAGNFAVSRLSEAGAPDATFGTQGLFSFDAGFASESSRALSLTGDGRLVIGGRVPGTGDRWGTAVARITNIDTLPTWLASGSSARWDAGTKALTLTGTATITSAPGGELPSVNASGSGASLRIDTPSGVTLSLASLKLSNGATAALAPGGSKTLVLGSLSIGSGAEFDLATHAMVIRSGGTSGVQASIAAGSNHGAWNGKGVFSSTAAANPAGTTALGFASNAQLNRTTIAGVTGLTPADVLVKYTYYGDSDLSGHVTLDDFTLFLGGYQSGGSGWLQGDYDYSGGVDLDDFTRFLSGYQNQGPPLP